MLNTTTSIETQTLGVLMIHLRDSYGAIYIHTYILSINVWGIKDSNYALSYSKDAFFH